MNTRIVKLATVAAISILCFILFLAASLLFTKQGAVPIAIVLTSIALLILIKLPQSINSIHLNAGIVTSFLLTILIIKIILTNPYYLFECYKESLKFDGDSECEIRIKPIILLSYISIMILFLINTLFLDFNKKGSYKNIIWSFIPIILISLIILIIHYYHPISEVKCCGG